MTVLTHFLLAATVLSASSNVMAKEFILNNVSANHKPMTVQLQVVRQNPGKPAVVGETRTLQLTDSTPITFEENGFAQVGITVLAVNGHQIPSDQFSHISENALNSAGPVTLDFSLEEKPGGHGTISVVIH